MSNIILQQNLERIIKERGYHVQELEREARVGKNSIYYILKGIVKKPSAALVQSIADAIGVTVRDLLTSPIKIDILDKKSLDLINSITSGVIKQVKESGYQLTYVDVTNIVKELFDYTTSGGGLKPDQNLIRWVLQQKCSNKQGSLEHA